MNEAIDSTRKQIEEKVRKIVMKSSGCESDELNGDTSLRNDLSLDSLDIVEIIMNVEKEFDIMIDDDDVDKMDTFNSVIDYLVNRNKPS